MRPRLPARFKASQPCLGDEGHSILVHARQHLRQPLLAYLGLERRASELCFGAPARGLASVKGGAGAQWVLERA